MTTPHDCNSSIGVLWAQFGPYHFARTAALQKLAAPVAVRALEMANLSADYQWSRSAKSVELVTLCPGTEAEWLPFRQVFIRTRRILAELKLDVCLLPGYAPKQSLAALLAAKSLGLRTVMMNESHAGTARARGIGAWIKRRLVGMFDAALVGGSPHKRYFAALGLPSEKIFTGYDSVDNDYFARRAGEVRSQAAGVRARYGLPERYFLSLGRFVAKKNLSTLLRAYRRFLDAGAPKRSHLVMVGSGPEEPALRKSCAELGIPVYEKCDVPGSTSDNDGSRFKVHGSEAGVHFYGFRQIEENPIFYALADAFVLPSLHEEWGLVVNEAMASGLPVVVSETAGCAEDLLKRGSPIAAGKMHEWSPRMAMQVRQNGFVFDPRSVESLVNVLLALESNDQLRAAMGRNSRAAADHFSCDNFARNALLAVSAAAGNRPAAHQASNSTRPSAARNGELQSGLATDLPALRSK